MGHRIFHRNNPLKSRSENHYKNKHISYKDVKYVQSLRMDPRTDRWSPDKKAIRKAHSGELKTIVVLMGLISNGKNVVLEKMSKMLKAPYHQQVFN